MGKKAAHRQKCLCERFWFVMWRVYISYLHRINKNTVRTFLRDISFPIDFIYMCDLFCAQKTMNSHWEFSIRFVAMVPLCARIDHSHTHINLSVVYSDTVWFWRNEIETVLLLEHRSSVMAILIGTSNSHSLLARPSFYLFVVWWTRKFDSFVLIRVPWQHRSIPGSLFHIQIRPQNQFNDSTKQISDVQLSLKRDLLAREISLPIWFQKHQTKTATAYTNRRMCHFVCVFHF